MNFILLSAVGSAFRLHGTDVIKQLYKFVLISDRTVSIPPLCRNALFTFNAE